MKQPSIFVTATLLLLSHPLFSAESGLPRSDPEPQGVSSVGILDFIETADREIPSMHSFMFVRHGHVVAESWWGPYDSMTPHELYSLSKSFTSTAVGMAIAEGKLRLEDKVGEFFPMDMPDQPSLELQDMTVRDLLMMASGHTNEPKVTMTDTEPWTKTFLAHPVNRQPGSHFLYNTPATYMLSAIVQKQSGLTVLEYLKPRLFEPLGIENPTWGTSPQGISLGGYGLNLRTEDIAKFGQLYLQKGKWGDRQLVPADWVTEATSNLISTGRSTEGDWGQGYGYQFWQCRHSCFRGDGAFGQYCLVLPEHDAVIAITSGVKDMQGVLNLIWKKILPALHQEALATDENASKQLASLSAKLLVPTPSGEATSTFSPSVAGKRYTFAPNGQKIESLSVEPTSHGSNVLLIGYEGKGEERIPCGLGMWERTKATAGQNSEQLLAASGGWTADAEFTAKLCFYATPFTVSMRLQFKDDQLLLDTESNVGFGEKKRPQLTGTFQSSR